jgi:hypothetical protein
MDQLHIGTSLGIGFAQGQLGQIGHGGAYLAQVQTVLAVQDQEALEDLLAGDTQGLTHRKTLGA